MVLQCVFLCRLCSELEILFSFMDLCDITMTSSVFQNFCVRGLELFSSYLFKDTLELYDWNLIGKVTEIYVPEC